MSCLGQLVRLCSSDSSQDDTSCSPKTPHLEAILGASGWLLLWNPCLSKSLPAPAGTRAGVHVGHEWSESLAYF